MNFSEQLTCSIKARDYSLAETIALLKVCLDRLNYQISEPVPKP